MSGIVRGAWVSIGLGVVSVVAIGVSHLALTDIWHGEGDLSIEWTVLRASAAVVVLFHVAALVTLIGVVRRGRRSPDVA